MRFRADRVLLAADDFNVASPRSATRAAPSTVRTVLFARHVTCSKRGMHADITPAPRGSLPLMPLTPLDDLPPYASIEVDSEGRWFKDPWGRTVLLDRTRVMRRILRALVRRAVDAPGEPMTTHELFREGWLNENVRQTSAQSRVYMALSRLRAFGLAGVLVRSGAGYLIAREVSVHVKVPA